jgi:exopolysaccharide biosynthesis polyprenyl glycosylphosphotransferase
MRLHYKEKTAVLLVLDLAAMALAFAAAFAAGYKAPVSMGLAWSYEWSIFSLLASVIVLFFILDLYSLHKLPKSFLPQVLMICLGLFLSAVLVTFLFFFFRNVLPRAVFLLFYLASLFLISGFRYLFNRLTLSLIYWKILIVGDKNSSEETASIISSLPYLHARVAGYVSGDAETGPAGELPLLGPPDFLPGIVAREGIDQVLVAYAGLDGALAERLLECLRKKVRVTDLESMLEDLTGQVRIDRLGARWFIRQQSLSDKRYFWYAKRSFDVVVGLCGICVAAPFFPFVALLIKLDSRGPVFYRQQRVGRGNREFRVWKLRTMVVGADKNNVHWTVDHDARITRIGKLLRTIRFDEVPQLLNILKGDMSLIGPRPEAVSLEARYAKAIPHYRERHLVTPGITGWAQINYGYGDSIEDARNKLTYDFYYIKNRSISLDLTILLRTIRTVLTGKGAR